jgi:hypothetical protein
MRSGRATVGESRKNDDLERTRDQKRRSSSSANADPGPIGDRTRTEDPGLVTSRLKANSSARASRMRPLKGWKRPFEDPIPLPGGRQLVTLQDAGNYITKLPKAEHIAKEWQAAVKP